MKPDRPVLIVTAADESFARTLWQYLRSAERAKLPKLYSFVVYDLGIAKVRLEFLQRRFAWCEFRPFQFEKYPAHAAMEPNNFAWKPLIVAEACFDFEGIVFWFDSAVIFKSDLAEPLQRIAADGVWYLRGHTSLELHANPNTLAAMNVPLEVRHLSEISGGSIGFATEHSIARQLVTKWRDFALQKSVISEQNSKSLQTSDGHEIHHKYDQAILSSLILTMVFHQQLPLHNDEVDISSSNPISFFTTRNKVKPWLPYWADPVVRAYYSIYKFFDRHWLGFSRCCSKKFGGFERYLKERFDVTVQVQTSGATRQIPSPRYSYYADPFIWKRDGETWLFVEEFQHSKDQGRLAAIQLDEDLGAGEPLPLKLTPEYAALDCHASFPFLFEELDQVFMIPETCERRSVDLYVCTQWPNTWALKRRLLFGLDAADTMMIKHEGLWWMFTSVRDQSGKRALQIFSLTDLETATPQPHPINSAGIYRNRKAGTGRNAGYLEHHADGSIHRFMQNSKNYYGQGGSFQKIVALDLQTFSEIETLTDAALKACHHFSKTGNLSAWDTRTRHSMWQLVQFSKPRRNE